MSDERYIVTINDPEDGYPLYLGKFDENFKNRVWESSIELAEKFHKDDLEYLDFE